MNLRTIGKRLLRLVYRFVRIFKDKEIIAVPQMVDSTKSLEGKSALITGGSGEIGMAIAKHFIKSGCYVVIAGTNENKLKKCIEILNKDDSMAKGIVMNMLDVSSMENKVEKVAEMLPQKKIDILVNCAGVLGSAYFEEMTEAEYDRIMDINMKGTYFMSQAICKHMINKKIKGHILNVSSSSALRPAWSPYHLSKWAIKGFTKGLADIMIPYGIVVNAIAPGPVATKMMDKKEGDTIYLDNPVGRYALPDEIANLAVFMVSEMGNMIIGDTFYITGGSGILSLHK